MDKKINRQINSKFFRLEHFGFKVFNFNKNALSFGLKHFVNHIIVSKKYLIFIEINPEKEILSDEKRELQLFLSHLSSFKQITSLSDYQEY